MIDSHNVVIRKDEEIALYKKVYLIRTAEEAIIQYYSEDEMKTPMHMSMGEEALVVGVCHALTDKDQVLGTYRSHALFLAKTQDVNMFFAEMYGKTSGSADGKSGSMHLSKPSKGMILSSAIVGSSISTAVGVALANKMQKNNKITAVFFGDGAVDAGTFWESLNFACLSKLPILFVLEDNGIAVHTDQSLRYGYNQIETLIEQYQCDLYQSDSTNVYDIYNLTVQAIEKMRATQRPVFMKLKYYRYLEHVGVNFDFHDNYRDEQEYKRWLERDPVVSKREFILNNNILPIEKLEAIETSIRNKINDGVVLAKSSPFSPINVLTKDVFK